MTTTAAAAPQPVAEQDTPSTQVPLVVAMLNAAHTLFAGQQAQPIGKIQPLGLTPQDRGRGPAPLLLGEDADAILAELDGF